VSGLERGRVVLRIEDRESLAPSLPLVTRNGAERAAPSLRFEAAPAVQLVGRDSFVAETATKLEQLQASLRIMSREVTELTRKVAELHDTATQDHRWHAFQESERRARETKFDETLRCCRDLKARLDRIEPRTGGDYHAYNSFEAVSRKLAELEHFRDEARRVERKVTLRAWLFCGAMVLAASIIVTSHVLAG
jgi:hypothetical protein